MNTVLENTIETLGFTGLNDDLFSILPNIEKAEHAPCLHVSDLDQQNFYKDWVANNKPCLIKEAVKHWPATQKVKEKDYWLSICDDFHIRIYPHMNHNMWERQKVDSERITFHEAIKRLHRNEDYILSIPSEKIAKDNRFSGLLKEMPGFSFLSNKIKPRMYDQRRFFMYRRAATSWHYHNIDETLMCQVSGAKKVVLLPPDVPKAKYICEFLTNEHYMDGKQIDETLKLEPMIVTVEEGDALYIPPYWHHAVVPVDDNIGFTLAYCWKSPWYKLGDFSNYFVRKLYKDGFWPLKITSLLMPFVGIISITHHFTNKIYRVFKP
ncbi:cupin-like domain-containing protein [Aquimarina sp. 2304DJ70-9]|uniref:cupin-like domain-containing protein n=1 Tax=Aquimarina penaris TaxID=3231044 RepID=UPI0034619C4F